MGAVASPCARVERPVSVEHGEDLQTFDRALLAQARCYHASVLVDVWSILNFWHLTRYPPQQNQESGLLLDTNVKLRIG